MHVPGRMIALIAANKSHCRDSKGEWISSVMSVADGTSQTVGHGLGADVHAPASDWRRVGGVGDGVRGGRGAGGSTDAADEGVGSRLETARECGGRYVMRRKAGGRISGSGSRPHSVLVDCQSPPSRSACTSSTSPTALGTFAVRLCHIQQRPRPRPSLRPPARLSPTFTTPATAARRFRSR